MQNKWTCVAQRPIEHASPRHTRIFLEPKWLRLWISKYNIKNKFKLLYIRSFKKSSTFGRFQNFRNDFIFLNQHERKIHLSWARNNLTNSFVFIGLTHKQKRTYNACSSFLNSSLIVAALDAPNTKFENFEFNFKMNFHWSFIVWKLLKILYQQRWYHMQ